MKFWFLSVHLFGLETLSSQYASMYKGKWISMYLLNKYTYVTWLLLLVSSYLFLLLLLLLLWISRKFGRTTHPTPTRPIVLVPWKKKRKEVLSEQKAWPNNGWFSRHEYRIGDDSWINQVNRSGNKSSCFPPLSSGTCELWICQATNIPHPSSLRLKSKETHSKFPFPFELSLAKNYRYYLQFSTLDMDTLWILLYLNFYLYKYVFSA
jgi:hypothetical protein